MKEDAIETANVVASVAHDLRTPLNAVIGFSRLMLKGIDGPLNDLQTADLEAVHTNGNLVLQMIDNLIDLAKAQAGWSEPTRGAVHLHPLLEKVVSLAAATAKEQHVVLEYSEGELSAPVIADPSQLQKAAERLTRAAIQLASGGKVEVKAVEEQAGATVWITASGLNGMMPEVNHSLEAFRTGGSSSEHRVDVTALELIVSKQLLALNGCTLDVDEVSEGQVQFTLHLPLANL